jgi:hypothetical protein
MRLAAEQLVEGPPAGERGADGDPQGGLVEVAERLGQLGLRPRPPPQA